MKELFERAKHGAAALRGRSAALREKLRVGRKSNPQSTQPGGAEPKPPLPLPQCFMLSHLEEDGPVRRDGVKVGVCEVMGLDSTSRSSGLSPESSTHWTSRRNCSCASTRRDWRDCGQTCGRPSHRTCPRRRGRRPSPSGGSSQTWKRATASWTGALPICEFERDDDLRGLLARSGLSVHPLRGRQLRMFLMAAAIGAPTPSGAGRRGR